MDRRTNRSERAKINALYKAPPSLFRVWLRSRAAAGDLDAAHALARLRANNTLNERPVPMLERTQSSRETTTKALSGSLGRTGDFDRTFARTMLGISLQSRGDTLGDEATARNLWRKQLERERTREHTILREFHDDLRRCNDILQEATDIRAARSVIAMDTVLAMLRLRRLVEMERTMTAEAIAHTSSTNDPARIPDLRLPSLPLMDLSHRVGENGAVVYALSGSGQEFTDTGTRLDFDNVDATTIQLGLLLARQKWLDGIELRGTQAFKLAALREAVALDITITNPELQQLQASLLKERNQRSREQQFFEERQWEARRSTQAPQISADLPLEAVLDAARATAKTHGFTIDTLREHTEYIDGTIRSAWSAFDKGFVVVTREDKTELVVTTIERAHEAYDRMNERTSMNLARENLLEEPRMYAREHDFEHTL